MVTVHRRRFGVALAAALVGSSLACVDTAPEPNPWKRPQPRPASGDASCAGIAAASPGATWSDGLALTVDEGPLGIADASVMGGPFEAPVRVDVPRGRHAVRVLLGKTRIAEGRPLCATVRVREGEPASWKIVGTVPVDTDTVMLVDEPRWTRATRAVAGDVHAALEAEAGVLADIVTAAGRQGIPMTIALPTLARTVGPVRATDRAALVALLRDKGAYGKLSDEPASPAWRVLAALGDAPAAAVDVEGAKGAAVAVESGQGDGAYVVAVGLDAAGTPVTVELRLSP